MNRIRVFGLVAVTLLFGPLTYAKTESTPRKTVCAAISASGRTGAASLAAKNLNLEIVDPSGHSTTLSALLQTEGDECRAFFDHHNGNLLAVAVWKQLDTRQGLRILIANTEVPKWVANFSVEPRAGLLAPLSLAGFLQDTESLVVEGSGQKAANPAVTTIGTTLVDTSGKVLTVGPFERTLEGRPQSFCDTIHNRLWYLSSPHFCPIRSTTLIGEPIEGPEVASLPNERSYCLPNVVGYPDGSTLLLAATMSERDAVWRVDFGNGTGEEIPVPRDRFPKGDQIDGNASLSPDGQVFAFSRHQFSYGRFDNFSYKGSDIVVVQVHPLQVLGIIVPVGDLNQHGFAVDHRDGRTSVLVFSNGVWKRLYVGTP